MHAPADPTGRVAGQHTRASVLRLRLRALLALGVLAVATALLGRAFGLQDPTFVGSEVALLATMFVIERYVMPLVHRRDQGATAEEQVGGLLDQLSGGGWHVIHDASLGHGNVDHVLIGPAGAFTVETKSRPGPVTVRRIHGATLRQVDAERRTVERVTGISVEPLLVFSRAWVDRPLARRKGVRVVPASMLLGYLERHGQKLSEEEIESAHRALTVALLDHDYEQQLSSARERFRITR